MTKPFVVFNPGEKAIEIKDQRTVLEMALSGGVELNHSCGGMGSCGTCRVEVLSPLSDLAPRTELELEMAEERGFAPEERLACQLTPKKGLSVWVPDQRKTKKGLV